MPDRLLVSSGMNLLARGFQAVPTDRRSRDGHPRTRSLPWHA
jgi:hypothetical protein